MLWKFLKQKGLFPKGLNWVQHWVSWIGQCSLTSTGSMEVLPGNQKMHLLRRDVSLNDVNWSLVATSFLGNSGYQNDRKIYAQSKMTLRLAISWEPRAKQIRTDLLTSLPLASRWIIPGSIHCHSVINNFNFRVQYLIYALINFFSSFSSAAMNETIQPVCLFKFTYSDWVFCYYTILFIHVKISLKYGSISCFLLFLLHRHVWKA